MNKRLFSYMACLYGGTDRPGQRPFADGENLAKQCLDKLARIENQEQFPPKLLVLLASPEYTGRMKELHLLAGIHKQFELAGHMDVQLIGSSVAGVIFDGAVHEHGAMLMCLASRLLNVRTAAGEDARSNPEHAIQMLLSQLSLSTQEERNANLVGGGCLLTFLPGFGEGKDNTDYLAPELYRQLHANLMGRITIAGGVSSMGGPATASTGLQFLGKNVYEDTIVSACIESDVPFGIGANHGLQEVPLPSSSPARFLEVTRLSENRRRIEEFSREGKPADILRGLKKEYGFILFEEMNRGEGPVLVVPNGEDDGSITLHRSIQPDTSLRFLKPDHKSIQETAAVTVRQSRKRIHMEKPIGCLLMACRARYHNRTEIGLDVKAALVEVGQEIQGAPCVGGLFDGEMGLTESGLPIFTNWSVASIVIGDEMRERSAVDRGFSAMAKYGPKLMAGSTIEEAVTNCLDMVFEVGYPGAMLSLILRDEPRDWIIAQKAVGTHLQKIVPLTRRPLKGGDILDVVVATGESIFIPDARKDDHNDQAAVKAARITSQYIIPLRNPKGQVFATLQVDLGDVSYHDALHKLEKMVLDSLGDEVAEALNRVIALTQLRISRDLDRVLVESMSSGSVEQGVRCYLEAALKTIGADAGHVRLADPEKSQLELIAGKGDYYEHARGLREKIPLLDHSPTCAAFYEHRIIVVNNAQSDPNQKCMRERYEHKPEIADALSRFAAYANVPLFDEAGKVVGTVNIAALRSEEQDRAWFFTPAIVDSLDDFGRRLMLLIRNIDLRLREDQYSRSLKFLLEVGPQLGSIASFTEARDALDEAVRRFYAATEATAASLFLWDEEVEAFVLRAESGWNSRDWVHAARYTKRTGWTGKMALEYRPKYFKGLQDFKESTGHQQTGSYVKQMFGRESSEEVDALALPLCIGRRNLGVLTLHWIRKEGDKRNVFAIHDDKILQEAADNMAAVVDAVMSQEKKLWQEQEQGRRETVLHALIRPASGQLLYNALCSVLGENFRAQRVDLYLCEKSDTAPGIRWNTAWHRLRSSPIQGEILPDDAREADDLVKRCVSLEGVEVNRRKLNPVDKTDPKKLATEGLVVRACIPLKAEDRVLGVLDLAWGVKRYYAPGTIAFHSETHLQLLGKSIAAIIRSRHLWDEREQARIQVIRNQRAVRTMDVMLFQFTHRLKNLLRSLVRFPLLLEEDPPRWTEELRHVLRDGLKMVERPINVARGITRPESAYFCLREVIDALLLDQVDVNGRLPCIEGSIETILSITTEILVYANKDQVQESLVNVINNAILHGLPRGGVLDISSKYLPGQQNLLLIIKDNGGVGMSSEQIKAAKEGFGETQNGMGVGLLIAMLLIETNRGTLEIESVKGKGTCVTITLPKEPLEKLT